jgi:hypothetical protein
VIGRVPHRSILAAIAMMPLALTLATAQPMSRELTGRWGAYPDPEPAPKAESPEQALTIVRRQQMRANSAHYRSVEAALLFQPRASLAADADALARIADNLPRLFELKSPSAGKSGARAEIWDEPRLFGEHLAGFRTATRDLAAAASANDRDAAAKALAAVRYQCLACHFHYRRIEGRPGAETRRAR